MREGDKGGEDRAGIGEGGARGGGEEKEGED